MSRTASKRAAGVSSPAGTTAFEGVKALPPSDRPVRVEMMKVMVSSWRGVSCAWW